jgi:hypothetical protein
LFNEEKRINWRYIWSRYCLLVDEKYMLVGGNMNMDLKKIGVGSGTEIRFKRLVRRRKRNGPIRLREDEKSKYIVI